MAGPYPQISINGRWYDLVHQGSGVVLPIVDARGSALAEGTVLHSPLDSRWNNLAIVRTGATTLEDPGVIFNWLDGYRGDTSIFRQLPAPTVETTALVTAPAETALALVNGAEESLPWWVWLLIALGAMAVLQRR